MEDVILIVDFLHEHASKHRQFKLLLEDYDAHYGDSIHHTVVQWLSKGFLSVHEKLPLKIHATLEKMAIYE